MSRWSSNVPNNGVIVFIFSLIVHCSVGSYGDCTSLQHINSAVIVGACVWFFSMCLCGGNPNWVTGSPLSYLVSSPLPQGRKRSANPRSSSAETAAASPQFGSVMETRTAPTAATRTPVVSRTRSLSPFKYVGKKPVTHTHTTSATIHKKYPPLHSPTVTEGHYRFGRVLQAARPPPFLLLLTLCRVFCLAAWSSCSAPVSQVCAVLTDQRDVPVYITSPVVW